MPAVILPQFLLCGLLVPRADMPRALELASDVMPLSYVVDAMTEVTRHESPDVLMPLTIVVGFIVALLLLGAATLRRRTP